VLVVDDGSRDDIQAQVPALSDQRVRVLRNEHSQGVSNARNRAVEEAAGDWVAFLDDDDLWAPTKLARMLEVATTAGAGWAYSTAFQLAPDGRPELVMVAAPPAGLAQALLRENLIPCPSVVIARRELVLAAGGFDPAISVMADWDLWIGLAQLAPAARCGEPLAAWQRHGDNMGLRDAGARVAELAHMRAKHAAAARAAGVSLGDRRVPRPQAAAHLQAGHRLRAAGLYARIALRTRRPGDLARAAGALLGPGVTRGRGLVYRARNPPPAWLERYTAAG
jgi:glycosyltransferase involved in cell wall biosynthesis